MEAEAGKEESEAGVMKVMRSALLVTMACGHLFGQIGPVSIGAKVGVPLSDSFETETPATCPPAGGSCGLLNYSSKTKRYTLGPSVELRLPYGLALEFDALYNRLNYDSYLFVGLPNGQSSASARTGADRWEFPLLLKWRYRLHRFSPFVDGGVALDHISRVESHFTSQQRDMFGFVTENSGETSNPSELTHQSSGGVVAGGGIEIRALGPVRFMPEIRYTRWSSRNFTQPDGGAFRTNKNEVTLLLGIAF